MFDQSSYTIGWICALSTEYVAARQFLDKEHKKTDYFAAPNNSNSYSFGRIGRHYVVIAVMPKDKYGITSAAVAARDIVYLFPNLRIGLIVGIRGGAPSRTYDIRLGDIVVSSLSYGKGGVY